MQLAGDPPPLLVLEPEQPRRQLPQLLLGPLAVGDVLDHQDQLVGRPVFTPHAPRGDARVNDVAVAADEAFVQPVALDLALQGPPQ